MSVYHEIYKKNFEEYDNKVDFKGKSDYFATWFPYYICAHSTFSWDTKPLDDIPAWLIEESLIYNGLVAFFEDNGKYKIYPCYPAGELLENGQYSEYVIIARNGKTWRKTYNDIVLCYDNSLRLPYLGMVNTFAEKSTNALSAVDITLKKATYPQLAMCENEDTMVSLSQIENLDNAEKKLLLAKLKSGISKNPLDMIRLFDNRMDDVLSLWDVHVRYRNLFYTLNGINNVEIQKRERLTEAEGSGNDEITRYSLLDDRYKQRKNFVDSIKEKFNVDLNFEINRDVATVYNLETSNENKLIDQQITVTKGSNIQAVNSNVQEGEGEE